MVYAKVPIKTSVVYKVNWGHGTVVKATFRKQMNQYI